MMRTLAKSSGSETETGEQGRPQPPGHGLGAKPRPRAERGHLRCPRREAAQGASEAKQGEGVQPDPQGRCPRFARGRPRHEVPLEFAQRT